MKRKFFKRGLKKNIENLQFSYVNSWIMGGYKDFLELPLNTTTEQQITFLATIKEKYGPVSIAKSLFETEATIISLEKYSQIGNYFLNSEIAIEAKYQDYYDNGMVMVYLKNPLNDTGIWEESVQLINFRDPITGYLSGASCYLEKITKDKVYLNGRSYRLDEALVNAAKFDVKILFIPASEVVTMGAAKIDTHNLKAVTRYLGVLLN